MNKSTVTVEIDTIGIVNRVYPLGYGELNIKEVNNGFAYIEDKESISKYGLREFVWVDKFLKDANLLKNNAQDLLNERKEPKVKIGTKEIKIGDTAYYVGLNYISQTEVFDILDNKIHLNNGVVRDVNGLSKDVFFDEDSANKRLREIKY